MRFDPRGSGLFCGAGKHLPSRWALAQRGPQEHGVCCRRDSPWTPRPSLPITGFLGKGTGLGV